MCVRCWYDMRLMYMTCWVIGFGMGSWIGSIAVVRLISVLVLGICTWDLYIVFESYQS